MQETPLVCNFSVCWGEESIGSAKIVLDSTCILIKELHVDFCMSDIEVKRMLMSRCIPADYINYKIFNCLAGIPEYAPRVYEFAYVAAVLSYELSLTDPLWLNPKDRYVYNGRYILEPTTYNAINFYENSYSPDVGDILTSPVYHMPENEIHPSFYAPELTTEGTGCKRWAKTGGVNYLCKYFAYLTQEDIQKKIHEKTKIFKLAKENSVLVPDISQIPGGWMTNCLCEKGDILFSEKMLKNVFHNRNEKEAKTEFARRFHAEYVHPNDKIKTNGIIIRKNGTAKDIIW